MKIKLKGFSHYENTHECFQQFRALAEVLQSSLRHRAAQHLIDRGCEEVGSSDISCELFEMWKSAGYDWYQAIRYEVDQMTEVVEVAQ